MTRHTTLDARTTDHAQLVRAGVVCRADQDSQSGRVDAADGGQVEQRCHSVRPAASSAEPRRSAVLRLELAGSSY